MHAELGVIIRDRRGKVLLSPWKVLSRTSSVVEFEVCTCRERLQLAAEWTSHHAILQSDSLAIIRYLSLLQKQINSDFF